MRSETLQSRAGHSVTLLFGFDYSSSAFVNICASHPTRDLLRSTTAITFVLAFSELETPHFKLTCMRHCKWHRQPFVICRLVHVDVVDSRTASHAAYKMASPVVDQSTLFVSYRIKLVQCDHSHQQMSWSKFLSQCTAY